MKSGKLHPKKSTTLNKVRNPAILQSTHKSFASFLTFEEYFDQGT